MSSRETHLTEMVERWDELRGLDYENDHDKATFFRTLRATYLRGQSGDQQFSADVNANLDGISGQKASDYIKVLRAYPRRMAWTKLGGFASLFFLTGLQVSATQRRRVMRLSTQKADSSGRNVTIAMVRYIAKEEGYVSARGRPGSTQLEQQRRVLAQYIYDKLDDIPDRVLRAMPFDVATLYA